METGATPLFHCLFAGLLFQVLPNRERLRAAKPERPLDPRHVAEGELYGPVLAEAR